MTTAMTTVDVSGDEYPEEVGYVARVDRPMSEGAAEGFGLNMVKMLSVISWMQNYCMKPVEDGGAS